MSFYSGFEKVAVAPGVIGTLSKGVGTAAKGVKTTTKAIKGYATGRRVARYEGYRAGESGKIKPIGGKHVLDVEGKPTGAVTPGDPSKAKAALGRLDRAKDSASKGKQSIFQKHPFMTAAGTLIGAKALLGGGQQQTPPPPPQVVQY